MFLARVTGHVIATQKDKALSGQKLFVVEPLNVKYDAATNQPASLGNTNRAIVAIDVVGAGEGQLVLIVQGSSARMMPSILRSTRRPRGSQVYMPGALRRM